MTSLLMSDSVFSPVHYPDVTLSANEELTGSTAAFFSTLRREDGWESVTYNADAWIKATHVQPRAVSGVVLWAHNLRGKAYRLQVSNDDFGTTETLIDVTIPANPGVGDVDDALGVLTDDGMWIKRVPVRYAKYIRQYVPAMGASLRPRINGIVGVPFAFDRNRGDLVDGTEVRAEEMRSHRGVVGRGEVDVSRNGSVPIQCPSHFDYEVFRYQLWRYETSPALLVFDEARAEQAVMARRPVGRLAFKETRDYFPPSGELMFDEHDHG